MSETKLGRAILGIALSSVFTLMTFAACGGSGNTDGGTGADNDAGVGTQFVSNGPAGSTLRISLFGSLTTGGTVDFLVTATDPNGGPLVNIRIFCESEHGIAIIEPSNGRVAFEHTNASGIMSGTLGGLTPGSFLLECRGPQGFNLVDRISLLVTGDVPEGFDGFPNAAGGNLGGGVLVEQPGGDVRLNQVLFSGVGFSATPNGRIDISQIGDCDPSDTVPVDPEPFGGDDYSLVIDNQRDDRLFISRVTYTANIAGNTLTSNTELNGLVVDGSTEVTLVGTFTEFNAAGEKVFHDTRGTVMPLGTFNFRFTVTGTTGSGASFSASQTAALTFAHLDRCGG